MKNKQTIAATAVNLYGDFKSHVYLVPVETVVRRRSTPDMQKTEDCE